MRTLEATDWFPARHIGPSTAERDEMLRTLGVASLEALADEALPSSIRLEAPLDLPPPESESQYLRRLSAIARRNRVCRSYIGLGIGTIRTLLPRRPIAIPPRATARSSGRRRRLASAGIRYAVFADHPADR